MKKCNMSRKRIEKIIHLTKKSASDGQQNSSFPGSPLRKETDTEEFQALYQSMQSVLGGSESKQTLADETSITSHTGVSNFENQTAIEQSPPQDVRNFENQTAIEQSPPQDVRNFEYQTAIEQSPPQDVSNFENQIAVEQSQSQDVGDYILVSTTATIHASANEEPDKCKSYFIKETLDPYLICENPPSAINSIEVCTTNLNSTNEEFSPLPQLFTDVNNEPENMDLQNIATSTSMSSPNCFLDDEKINGNTQSPISSSCNSNTDTDFVDSPASIATSVPSKTGLKRKMSRKSNPGKKRCRNKNLWKDSIRKHKFNSGQAYITRSGEEKEERKIKPACDCRLQCHKKITKEERLAIFDKFWNLADHTLQWTLITNYAKRTTKKRITTGSRDSRRSFTVQYNLPKIGENEMIPVCRIMFLNTLCIGKDVVYTALEKVSDPTHPKICDNRGKHQNHKIVITESMIKSVCDHVSAFQPVESHYVRSRSSKRYLDSDLSFEKMFSMYQSWCEEHCVHEDSRANTERQYRDIINTHMNVSFFKPKKDQCDVCHAFRNTTNSTPENMAAYELHIKHKDCARKLKEKDKQEAIKNNKIITLTFDFQKVLACPHGEISLLYYKRKLSLFNLTAYLMATHEATCFMWHEGIAKRGANEVASCLQKLIEECVAKGAQDIRLWSDNCSGQNRNRIVFLMYLIVCKKLNIKITHRFLEKGHTQNEGDSVHALIERNSRGKNIYTPDEWYSLIRFCKVKKPFYNVVEVSQNDIYDYKALLKSKSWLKESTGAKMYWNNVKEIHVDPRHEDTIFFKFDLTETEYRSINCKLKVRTRGSVQNMDIGLAYSKPIYLPNLKFKDLTELCVKGVIPEKHHAFYNNLPHNVEIQESSSESDEDEY